MANFEMEVTDRLARLETNTSHLVTLVEAHCKEPSCQDCKLDGAILVNRTELKWTRRVFYGLLVLATGANNADWLLQKLTGG